MSRQQSSSSEAKMEKPQETESGEGTPETPGPEESCALALSYRVWAQEWARKKVKGNIQFPQRSEEIGGLRPGPPLGAEMGVSWIKALSPQKSGPVENLSPLCVAGWVAVKGEMTEA